jgi:hypothetical protein
VPPWARWVSASGGASCPEHAVPPPAASNAGRLAPATRAACVLRRQSRPRPLTCARFACYSAVAAVRGMNQSQRREATLGTQPPGQPDETETNFKRAIRGVHL